MGWYGFFSITFTALCFAIGRVLVARDADGHVGLQLSFLLNFLEALAGRKVDQEEQAKTKEEEAAEEARSHSFPGRVRIACRHVFMGHKYAKYVSVISPTMPGAVRRAQRLQAITASVTKAVITGVVIEPTRRCLCCAKREVPGHRLVQRLRLLSDKPLADLRAQAAARESAMESASQRSASGKSKSKDVAKADEAKADEAKEPSMIDLPCVDALYQIRDAMLASLEDQLAIAASGHLFQPSYFVSALLHSLLRERALSEEIARQASLMVEKKGGAAGRMAKGRVREAVLKVPPMAPHPQPYHHQQI